MGKGRLIVFEGIDGLGKTIQMEMMKDYCAKNGNKAVFLKFPNLEYNSDTAIELKKFFSLESGTRLTIAQIKELAKLFADNKAQYKDYINEHLSNGYDVFVDRYVLSNMAYQAAHIIDKNNVFPALKMLDYTYKYELVTLRLPIPDITIYFEPNFQFVSKNLSERKSKGVEDINENLELLNQVHDIYQYCFTLNIPSSILLHRLDLSIDTEKWLGVCGKPMILSKEVIHDRILNICYDVEIEPKKLHLTHQQVIEMSCNFKVLPPHYCIGSNGCKFSNTDYCWDIDILDNNGSYAVLGLKKSNSKDFTFKVPIPTVEDC